jgi:hypothetical protein
VPLAKDLLKMGPCAALKLMLGMGVLLSGLLTHISGQWSQALQNRWKKWDAR